VGYYKNQTNKSMKFLLIIQICSSIHSGCLEPLNNTLFYDSWKNCGMAGYEQAMNVMKILDPYKVNKERIYVQFTCKEVETTDI